MEMTHDERAGLYADFDQGRTAEAFLARTVVLVEGVSDQLALEALAARRDRDLDAEGVSIVSMGGSKNIRSFLDRYGPRGLDVRVAGLCDAAEEAISSAVSSGPASAPTSLAPIERLGFYVCVADLEDELIRSLSVAAVELVIDTQGDLESFRIFQKQPAWRGRTDEDQLRRFLGTHSGRKIRSAALLVDALDLSRVPRPLDCLLAHL